MNFSLNVNTNTNFHGSNRINGFSGTLGFQGSQASSVDTLDQLLNDLGNSDDPALRQLADDCTSSNAYDSGAGSDEESARDLLLQLRSALAQYARSQQSDRGFDSSAGQHHHGNGGAGSSMISY